MGRKHTHTHTLSHTHYWYEVGMLKVPANCLFLLLVWCPCMAVNVTVQYKSGLLPDIILLTQCYYHRVTRLNAMKSFCLCSLYKYDPT